MPVSRDNVVLLVVCAGSAVVQAKLFADLEQDVVDSEFVGRVC